MRGVRDQRGAAAVEAALLTPLLALVLFGIIEMSLYMRDVVSVSSSVHVGARQFSRLFLRETGETPAKAVERLRTEVAHAHVTGTTDSIEVIARRVGFASAERMRRAFIRLYGQPPQHVRRLSAKAA